MIQFISLILGIYSSYQQLGIPRDQQNHQIHSLERKTVFTKSQRLSPKRCHGNYQHPVLEIYFNFEV